MKKKISGILISRYSNSSIYIANALFDEGHISSVIFFRDKIENNFLKKSFLKIKNILLSKDINELKILKKNFIDINKSIECLFFKESNSYQTEEYLTLVEPNFIFTYDLYTFAKNLNVNSTTNILNISTGSYPFLFDNLMKSYFFSIPKDKIGFTIFTFTKDKKKINILCSKKIQIKKDDNFYSLYLKIIMTSVEYLCNGLIDSGQLNNNIKINKLKLPNKEIKKIIKSNFFIPFISCTKLFLLKIRLISGSFFRSNVKSFLGILSKFILQKKDQVFMYHDVSDEPTEFSETHELFVTTKVFEQQIKWIKKRFDVIDPSYLFDNRYDNQSKKQKAIITFDDGYESAFLNAAPVLRKYSLKAIIFINMAPVNKELFWPSLVRYLDNKDYIFKSIMEKKYGSKDSAFLLYKEDDVIKFAEANKSKIFKEKLNIYQGNFPTIKMLIDNSDVFIYGNHLYNHFNAANLTKDEFQYQINKNSLELAKINGKPEFFSYPFGQPISSYNESTDRILNDNKKIQKIFYANSAINFSLNQKFLNRCSLPPNMRFGQLSYFCFFRPFFNFYKSHFFK